MARIIRVPLDRAKLEAEAAELVARGVEPGEGAPYEDPARLAFLQSILRRLDRG